MSLQCHYNVMTMYYDIIIMSFPCYHNFIKGFFSELLHRVVWGIKHLSEKNLKMVLLVNKMSSADFRRIKSARCVSFSFFFFFSSFFIFFFFFFFFFLEKWSLLKWAVWRRALSVDEGEIDFIQSCFQTTELITVEIGDDCWIIVKHFVMDNSLNIPLCTQYNLL